MTNEQVIEAAKFWMLRELFFDNNLNQYSFKISDKTKEDTTIKVYKGLEVIHIVTILNTFLKEINNIIHE